jgi:hypothetical protein
VSVWNRSSWRPAGILVHRPRTLGLADRGCKHGIPVTGPTCTLIDIAGMVSPYEYHRDRASFERDRRRDVALQVAGFRVLRFTHRRLVDEPDYVIAELRQALAADA